MNMLAQIFSDLKRDNLIGSVESLDKLIATTEYKNFLSALESYDDLGTVLHILSANGRTAYIECILRQVKETDQLAVCQSVCDRGQTLLHRASLNGHGDVIAAVLGQLKSQLEKGKLVNLKDASEFTVLDYVWRNDLFNQSVWWALKEGLNQGQLMELVTKSSGFRHNYQQRNAKELPVPILGDEEVTQLLENFGDTNIDTDQDYAHQMVVPNQDQQTLNAVVSQQAVNQLISDALQPLKENQQKLVKDVIACQENLAKAEEENERIKKKMADLELLTKRFEDVEPEQRLDRLETAVKDCQALHQMLSRIPNFEFREQDAYVILSEAFGMEPAGADNLDQRLVVAENYLIKISQAVKFLQERCKFMKCGVPATNASVEQLDLLSNSSQLHIPNDGSSTPSLSPPNSFQL